MGNRVPCPKPEFPEWIAVECHVSTGWKSLCLRCQDRLVGLKRECVTWANEHAEQCPGARCEVCGTRYPGRSWDDCPACKESGVSYNRFLAGIRLGGQDFTAGRPYQEPPLSEPTRRGYKKGYEGEAEAVAKGWRSSPLAAPGGVANHGY